MENRIEKNLKTISRAVLVHLPDGVITLDDFVAMQETAVRDTTSLLVAKNLEVENAVNDLTNLIRNFPVSPQVSAPPFIRTPLIFLT